MDMLNPITVRLCGANINREIIKNIVRSEMKIESTSCLMGTVFRILTINPNKN